MSMVYGLECNGVNFRFQALFLAEWRDPQAKLANLAICTECSQGLRLLRLNMNFASTRAVTMMTATIAMIRVCS